MNSFSVGRSSIGHRAKSVAIFYKEIVLLNISYLQYHNKIHLHTVFILHQKVYNIYHRGAIIISNRTSTVLSLREILYQYPTRALVEGVHGQGYPTPGSRPSHSRSPHPSSFTPVFFTPGSRLTPSRFPVPWLPVSTPWFPVPAPFTPGSRPPHWHSRAHAQSAPSGRDQIDVYSWVGVRVGVGLDGRKQSWMTHKQHIGLYDLATYLILSLGDF